MREFPLKKGLVTLLPLLTLERELLSAFFLSATAAEDEDEDEELAEEEDEEGEEGEEEEVAAHTVHSSRWATKGWRRSSLAEGRCLWSRMQACDTKLPKRSPKMALGGRGTSPSCSHAQAHTHTHTHSLSQLHHPN